MVSVGLSLVLSLSETSTKYSPNIVTYELCGTIKITHGWYAAFLKVYCGELEHCQIDHPASMSSLYEESVIVIFYIVM